MALSLRKTRIWARSTLSWSGVKPILRVTGGSHTQGVWREVSVAAREAAGRV